MRRWWCIGGAALALVGCASSSQIERNARRDDERAQTLEARGDYAAALKAREAADKERSKAAWRAQHDYPVPPTLRLH